MLELNKINGVKLIAMRYFNLKLNFESSGKLRLGKSPGNLTDSQNGVIAHVDLLTFTLEC